MNRDLVLLGLECDSVQIGRYQLVVRRSLWRKPIGTPKSGRDRVLPNVADLVSVDFFVVPTATFRVLYVFVVLLHYRRRVVFNVTDSPTAAWTAQQIVEAFPDDSAPRYLRSVIATASTVASSGKE